MGLFLGRGAVGSQLAMIDGNPVEKRRGAGLGTHDIRSVLIAFAATMLACMVSLALKTLDDEIPPIWLGDAVLLAGMMVARPRRRYGLFVGGTLGEFAARLLLDPEVRVALFWSCTDFVGLAIAARFAPPVATVAELIRPKPLVRFLLGVVVTSTFASGLVAAALQGTPLGAWPQLASSSWIAPHALGYAIFTPSAAPFWTGEVTRLWRTQGRRKNGALLLLVWVATTAVFAQTQFHVLYWVLPPIALLAFQAEIVVVLPGLLVCFGIGMWFTMRGFGPFWIESFANMQGRIFALQLYYVAALAIALPISASQAQRDRLIARLRDGERRYRLLADNATDIVMSMGLDGRLTYVSPRVGVVLGYAPRELIGVDYPELALPEDRAALATAIATLTRGTVEAAEDSRFRRPDGRVLWMKTSLRLIVDPFTGKPEALTATVRDITEGRVAAQRLADERRELQALVYRDALTGLHNRRHFDHELERRWRKESRAVVTRNLAILMIDIDDYKAYNDHFGHQRGDECLRTVAQAIASVATRAGDVVARYGGEEFALIVQDVDQVAALAIAERIRLSVESLRLAHPASRNGIVTISGGVAIQRPCAGSDGNALVGAADRALYSAKRRGRNRTCAAEVELEDVANRTCQ